MVAEHNLLNEVVASLEMIEYDEDDSMDEISSDVSMHSVDGDASGAATAS